MFPQPKRRHDPNEAARWEAALTGQAPIPFREVPSFHRPSRDGGPSPEYLDYLFAELEKHYCDIRIDGPGEFSLVPDTKERCRKNSTDLLPRTLISSIRRIREDFIGAILDRFGHGLDELRYLHLTRPRVAKTVQWLNGDGDADYATGLELVELDWCAWRYENSDVWHSPTGRTWRE